MVVWFSIDKYGDYPQMTVTSREVEGFFFPFVISMFS